MILLPVTHFLYTGLVVFFLGLLGATLRQDPQVRLRCRQVAMGGAALVACALSRFWAGYHGQVLALLVVITALIHGVIVGWLAQEGD